MGPRDNGTLMHSPAGISEAIYVHQLVSCKCLCDLISQDNALVVLLCLIANMIET